MIPARIISIDDKVMMEWYKLPEPDENDLVTWHYTDDGDVQFIWQANAKEIMWERIGEYNDSRTIAEVENAEEYFNEIGIVVCFMFNNIRLELNQIIFIEPTENNKVKIIKI